MKKLLYAATALAIFAGCSKDLNEAPATVSGTKGNTLELNLTIAEDSRAIFDGDSHIKWEKGDKLGVIATKTAEETKGQNNFNVGSLTIADETANKPVFTGTVELDTDAGENLYIAGLYPYSAIGNLSNWNLIGVEVNLSTSQAPSQASWDGAADVMLMKQVPITAKAYESVRDYDGWDYYYYWKWTADAEITFAHIFGFGCIEFGTLPQDIANETVSKVTITATGEAQNIAGKFKVNLNQDVFSPEFTITDSTTANSISLNCDGTAALKDFKGWFVANPGLYDVTIDVATSGHKISFARKGLKIERAKIAKPVINYKDGDISESTDVDLTGGKSWQHDTNIAYAATGENQFFSKASSTADWGTGEGVKTMTYSLAYSDKNKTYYGKYYDFNGRAVQNITDNGVDKTSNITITSGAMYKGIEGIKVNAGNHYKWDLGTKSCDISAAIIDNKGVEHLLGAAQKITNDGVAEGTNYYFVVGTDTPSDGVVKLIFDNFSDNSSSSSNLYLGQLSVNPEPGISFESDVLELGYKACSGTTNVSIVCAKENPTVTTDAGWLKATIDNGVISYTAEANTASEKRVGNIIVKAKGNGEASKSLPVYQYSAIDLTGGKLWQHNTHTASNGGDSEGRFFTSKNTVATWGTLNGMPTADFSLYCISNGTQPTTVSPAAEKVNDIYVQNLRASNFKTGAIVIESKNAFKGINNIKVHGGMSSGTDTCDIEAYVINDDGTKTLIGEKQVLGGSPANPSGADFYFDAANAPLEGKVQIVFSNCTVSTCYNLYISELDVNPAPNIVATPDHISLGSNGGNGEIVLSVACATGAPKIEAKADWITVSYADGIISYTVAANTEDEKRVGNIDITATGNSTVTKSIVISQLGNKYAEFTLHITPECLIADLEKAKEIYLATSEEPFYDSTALSFETTLTATATDGSGLTKDIAMSFNYIKYETVKVGYLSFNGNYPTKTTGYMNNTTPIGVITNINYLNGSSSPSYTTVYTGTSLESLTKESPKKTEDNYPKYTWDLSVAEENAYGFFQMKQGYVGKLYEFTVTFIAEK